MFSLWLRLTLKGRPSLLVWSEGAHCARPVPPHVRGPTSELVCSHMPDPLHFPTLFTMPSAKGGALMLESLIYSAAVLQASTSASPASLILFMRGAARGSHVKGQTGSDSRQASFLSLANPLPCSHCAKVLPRVGLFLVCLACYLLIPPLPTPG